MKWYQNPINVFASGLGVFAGGALFYNFNLALIDHVVALILGGSLAFYGLNRWRPQPRHQKLNSFITVVIAILLLHPNKEVTLATMLPLVLAGALVVGAKFFPIYKNMPVFNPVVLGLLGFSVILDLIYQGPALPPTFVSWWGTDFAGWYALLILLPLVGYAAYKFRKLYLVGAFLGFNALWLVLNGEASALKYVYLSGTIYFMAGVMMLEPKTSPVKMWWQIGAAAVAVLVYRQVGYLGLGNVELWAIASVNAVHLLSKMPWSKLRAVT